MDIKIKGILIILGIVCLLSKEGILANDVFASTESIKDILRVESELIDPLDDFIEKEADRLRQIKKLRDKIKNETKWVKKSPSYDSYIGNPLNALYTVRRFPHVWFKINKLINTFHCIGFRRVYQRHQTKLPNDHDANAAVSAILRLQHYYKIKSRDLSKGIVPDAKTQAKPLNIAIKSELGISAFHERKWVLAKDWFEQVLKEIGTSQDMKDGIGKKWTLEKLSQVEFQLGNYKRALEVNIELKKLSPNDKKVDQNIRNCKKMMKKKEDKLKEKKEKEYTEYEINLLNYQALCRGEKIKKLTSKEEFELKCWYQHKPSLLRYKPQKVERVWLQPEILIYRDLLTDRQCQLLIEESKNKLKRANMMRDTKQAIHTDRRTSKHAWLTSNHAPIINQMEKRVQAITNLDMNSADQLQVNNYGIGGHYEFHFDWSQNNVHEVFGSRGNRIATLMYYLSDVDAGGGTAFVTGKTTVFPTKGDAVFWWNLKQNGEGDKSNLHGGCPVLAGQKWVANWWIHEVGQEFRRPCLKNPNV